MNNLIIAALTLVMLPAIANQASAKNTKNCKEVKNEIVVEKRNFTSEFENTPVSQDEMTTVNVDYIIGENGKAYITYISSETEQAKSEVVKFIESTSYNFDIVPGKIYSMNLTLKK
jgi:hypothetical protein